MPKREQCARLLDLFLVSVLLDAGAGNQWVYRENDGDHVVNGERTYARSEGLAIASLDMFCAGVFSSNAEQPYRVDGMLGSLLEPYSFEAPSVLTDHPK